MTPDLGDDPMSVMMRQIMTLFDEYRSKENAKHPPVVSVGSPHHATEQGEVLDEAWKQIEALESQEKPSWWQARASNSSD
jgi:hypothetical protein